MGIIHTGSRSALGSDRMRTRPFTWDDLIVMEVNSGVYTNKFRPRPGDVVVDAGAHIGAFSLLASNLVGPTGRVHAFEPHPENFALLEENTRDRANVTRHLMGLWAWPGWTTMRRELEANTGVAKLGDGDLKVYVAPLDSLVPRVDFLKVDVEGSEIPVLQGARSLLLTNDTRVVLEVDGWDGSPVRQLLASFGYNAEESPYWTNTLIHAWKGCLSCK